jgi:hypothetical protein
MFNEYSEKAACEFHSTIQNSYPDISRLHLCVGGVFKEKIGLYK